MIVSEVSLHHDKARTGHQKAMRKLSFCTSHALSITLCQGKQKAKKKHHPWALIHQFMLRQRQV
jgi:hypothetical protein